MRCFIGLAPDPAARKALAEIREQATLLDIGASPVLTENFHLTLTFIGEITVQTAREISRSLYVFPRLEDQYWEIDRSGNFPRSKTYWVSGPKNAFIQMYAEQSRRLLDRLGVSYDARSFKAHVTLLRKSRLETPLVLKPIPWKIGTPILYQSARDSEGILRYTPV